MTITRPKIFEPSIRAYEKPVHPEFFRIVASKQIRRSEYEVFLAITNVGHVVQWSDGNGILTEILSANVCELPNSAVLCRNLTNPGLQPLILPEGSLHQDLYCNRSQIEEAPFEFFGDFEKEYIRNVDSQGLLYRFGFTGRMNLGGFSYIAVETRRRQLKIKAVHTFSDDCVLLKTESTICMKKSVDS